MGRPTHELVEALKMTAERLRSGAPYRWTHQGACNCGHLAQTVTKLSKAEIHRMALEKAGDWSAHAIDYCPDSGFPIDHVIEEMLRLGLSTHDLASLERLSDPGILEALPGGRRDLDFRSRNDVVAYMEAWATLLEAELREAELREAELREAGLPAGGARAARPVVEPRRRRAA